MTSDTTETDTADYWRFIDTTVETVHLRHPELDVEALRLVMALTTATDAIRYDVRANLRETAGMVAPPLNLMNALDIGGEQTLAAAASQAHMTRAAASAMLDRLVKSGLAVRRPSAEDRRSILISLTPEGREAVYRIRAHYNHREHMWKEALTPEERATMLFLLDKLMAWHFSDADSIARG